MTAPRLVVDLEAIEANARALVGRLAPKGIRVTAVTKAVLGSPEVAAAFLRGGVAGLGDSRVDNLVRLRDAGVAAPMTMIRTPMLSEARAVVRQADVSMNSEVAVLDALADAARSMGTTHGVIVMVELGDLREGVAVDDVVALARRVADRPGLSLVGIGTNLACVSGTEPDEGKMAELSRLADDIETATGQPLPVVSGGNSANLDWALAAPHVGRVNDLRLGESILLGTETLHRQPIAGLRTDAFTLWAEVIEVQTKPTQPWGTLAQAAFGTPATRHGTGTTRQAILALGRQDTDPDGLVAPTGTTVLGMSSDHLVIDLGDAPVAVGSEMAFGLGYSALVRAATSPFVTTVHRPPSETTAS